MPRVLNILGVVGCGAVSVCVCVCVGGGGGWNVYCDNVNREGMVTTGI